MALFLSTSFVLLVLCTPSKFYVIPTRQYFLLYHKAALRSRWSTCYQNVSFFFSNERCYQNVSSGSRNRLTKHYILFLGITLKSGSISPSISNQQNSLVIFDAEYNAISFCKRKILKSKTQVIQTETDNGEIVTEIERSIGDS